MDSREFKYERFEIEGANALGIKLVGDNQVSQSLENARKLAQRLHEEQRDGVIMDYRQCYLYHTVAQFGELAGIFIGHAPKTCRIAYVYGPDNMMHAMFVTKLLYKGGFEAKIFSNWEDAEAYVRRLDKVDEQVQAKDSSEDLSACQPKSHSG